MTILLVHTHTDHVLPRRTPQPQRPVSTTQHVPNTKYRPATSQTYPFSRAHSAWSLQAPVMPACSLIGCSSGNLLLGRCCEGPPHSSCFPGTRGSRYRVGVLCGGRCGLCVEGVVVCGLCVDCGHMCCVLCMCACMCCAQRTHPTRRCTYLHKINTKSTHTQPHRHSIHPIAPMCSCMVTRKTQPSIQHNRCLFRSLPRVNLNPHHHLCAQA